MKIEVLSDTEAIVDGERVRVCPAITKESHFTILDALVNREHKIPHGNPHYRCFECDGYGVAKVREPPPPEFIGEWEISGPDGYGLVELKTQTATLAMKRDTVKRMLARFEPVDGKAEV